MPWTLRDLMSESTSITKLTSDDVQPSRVSFYVNQAQRDVANRIQQVEFERFAISSTSSGDDKLYLPADCERVLNLSFDTLWGNRNLPQRNIQDIDNASWGTQSGQPEYYVSYATWIELYPSPNSQYSLMMRYVGRLSEITNYDSIPSVDTRYHQAVLFKAVEYLAMRKGDEVQAAFSRSLYEKELDQQHSARAQRQLNRAGMHAAVMLDDQREPSTWDWETRNGP